MLFFRSEETLQAWCGQHGYPMGPIVTLHQLWGLAKAWYATRLKEEARRPDPDEIREIFKGLGLKEDFWNPKADLV